jgi:hypothetical protein
MLKIHTHRQTETELDRLYTYLKFFVCFDLRNITLKYPLRILKHSVYLMLMLMLIEEDLEAGILSQPTGKFPEGARQPRLIVLATGRKESANVLSTGTEQLIIMFSNHCDYNIIYIE